MKKGLALLLAASMSLSAFSSAFAAELTAQEKFDALKAKGIFEGYTDGTAGLDKEMTRAEFAMVLKRLMKLEEVKPATPTFKDLKTDAWYYGAIEAAVKAGYINGLPDGTFAPSANVTYEQLAKLLVGALNLEVDANATVEGTVSPKMAGYVKAALDAGLITPQSNYKAAVKRDVLVSATYVADATINKPVVTFGAKAVGAKKIEVTFGTAVDTSKVKIALKKGNTPVNPAKTTFAEDKKSVVLELATKLTKGEYTVTVSGVAAEDLVAKVAVEDEKVAKITFKGEQAAQARYTSGANLGQVNPDAVVIQYEVTNQYGEVINPTGLTFTTTKGVPTANNGVLTLDTTSQGGSDFILGEKVSVYALHESGVFAQQTFTVSAAAQASKIEIKGLYNADGKTPTVGDTAGNYYVEVAVQDQYGYDVPPALIGKDVIVTATNTNVFDVVKSGNDAVFSKVNDKLVLQLKASSGTTFTNAGKGIVLIMSKTTGARAELEVEVKEATKVAELTLSAPEIVVEDETVEIPFTAVDQNGNVLGKAKDYDLLRGITLTSAAGTLTWKVDYVADKVTLELNVNGANYNNITTATPAFITGTVNNKIVQLQISVNPAKKPVVVTGLKDVATAIAKNGSVTVANDAILVLDQYSRTKTLADFSGYRAEFTTSDAAKVSVGGSVTDAVYADGTDTSTTIAGVDAGSANITVVLKNGNTTVEGSEYTASFKTVTVADIESYEVSVVDAVYAGGAAYQKELKVEGKLADGSKVAVPVGNTDYYEVHETVAGLDYVTASGKGYFRADNTIAVDPGKEAKFGFAVIGKTKDGAKVVTNELTVSKVAPVITTLELTENGNNIRKISDKYAKITLTAAKSSTAWKTLAEELVDAKDQYGVAVAGNVVDTAIVTGAPANRADFKAQDTFNLVVGTANGKYETIKVIVVDTF